MPLPVLPVSPFPDVPQLPGVPAVMRDPAAIGSALTSGLQGTLLGKPSGATGIDADFSGELGNVSSGLNGYTQTDGSDLPADTATPVWGIFDQQGTQVIVPDTILVVDYKNDTRISEYPLEDGAFGSYNKVETPFDMQVRMAFAGTDSEREAFLASVDVVFKSLELYNIVTPDGVYENVTFDHRDMRRDARGGITMLTIELWAKEVRETATLTDPVAKAPDAAPQVNDGKVQAALPTPKQAAQIQSTMPAQTGGATGSW